eukprot:Skav228744  [mRNA]  locus=scaffold4149:6921:22508:- [translate_table: standard]
MHGRSRGTATEEDVQPQLTRRRPGQSSLTTARNETDTVTILSGTETARERGLTLGTPIAMMVRNQDQRKFDYANTSAAPRPGHADYTYQARGTVERMAGGGRASARETIGRVAAGAVAEKWLLQEHQLKIACWDSSIMDIDLPKDVAKALESDLPAFLPGVVDHCDPPSREEIDTFGTLAEDEDPWPPRMLSTAAGRMNFPLSFPSLDFGKLRQDGKKLYTRCPHPPTAAKMAAPSSGYWFHQIFRRAGAVTTVVSGMPVGLGEPCFDKLEVVPGSKNGLSARVMMLSKVEESTVQLFEKELATRTSFSQALTKAFKDGEKIQLSEARWMPLMAVSNDIASCGECRASGGPRTAAEEMEAAMNIIMPYCSVESTRSKLFEAPVLVGLDVLQPSGQPRMTGVLPALRPRPSWLGLGIAPGSCGYLERPAVLHVVVGKR